MTMSYDEMWDDTALVDSWNEAVEEYKYYHSLHARGEKVEDVLREADAKSPQINWMNSSISINEVKGGAEQQFGLSPIGDTFDEEERNDENPADSDQAMKNDNQYYPTEEGKLPQSGELPMSASLPQIFIGAGQDEGLKNLVMSWYYAGYYTGLYEGQQSAYQESAARQSSETSKKPA